MEKKSLRRLAVVTAIVAAAALVLAGLVGILWGPLAGKVGLPWGAGQRGLAPGRSIDERRSIDAAGLQRLSIESVSEELRVRYGEGRQVVLRLHGSFGGADAALAPSLEVSRAAEAARAYVDHSRVPAAGWLLSDLTLEVELPRAYRGALILRSVSGSLELGDLSLQEVALAGTSGDIRAGSLRADTLSLLSVSGDIRVQSAAARKTEVDTTSGEVRVGGLSGSVAARSVSGDLELSFLRSPGEVQVESTSGQVTLRMPPEAGFRLQARSTSGQLACALPIRLEDYASDAGRNVLAGAVGAGDGGTVRVRTVSGDIRIVE